MDATRCVPGESEKLHAGLDCLNLVQILQLDRIAAGRQQQEVAVQHPLAAEDRPFGGHRPDEGRLLVYARRSW